MEAMSLRYTLFFVHAFYKLPKKRVHYKKKNQNTEKYYVLHDAHTIWQTPHFHSLASCLPLRILGF